MFCLTTHTLHAYPRIDVHHVDAPAVRLQPQQRWEKREKATQTPRFRPPLPLEHTPDPAHGGLCRVDSESFVRASIRGTRRAAQNWQQPGQRFCPGRKSSDWTTEGLMEGRRCQKCAAAAAGPWYDSQGESARIRRARECYAYMLSRFVAPKICTKLSCDKPCLP